MAGFKTHIAASGLIGLGYGAAAYTMYRLPGPSCILAAGLCGVSGMLPDLDSGSGRPLRESLSFAAAVISTMLVDRFQKLGLSVESIIIASAAVYGLVRFGIGDLLHRLTVHRGMFHSIPTAIIFGELAFLLSAGDVRIRSYKACAVLLGFLSHLILDELYGLQWVWRRMAFKKSLGTALKLYSHHWWTNACAYSTLVLVTFLVFQDPGWTAKAPATPAEAASTPECPATALQGRR
jgi:membrane-bound metal-dependent hydrolase YbcI (DUF457 family)